MMINVFELKNYVKSPLTYFYDGWMKNPMSARVPRGLVPDTCTQRPLCVISRWRTIKIF